MAAPDTRDETGGARRGVAVLGDDPDRLLAGAVGDGGADLVDPEGAGAVVWAGGPADDLAEVLRRSPGVRWVQLPWAGVEPYVALLDEHPGTTWTCAKGIYADSVAEHALALALALRRGLDRHARAEAWTTDVLVEPLLGSGEVATVLGGGGIALRLAALLAPYGLRVRVVRRSAGRPFDAPHEAAYGADDLAEALRGARLLFVTLPATPATAQLVGAAELALLAPGAVVVNVGRGSVVDTGALVDALASGHLRGAGLDVTDPEPLPTGHALWSHPGVIVTSHTSNPDPWRRAQLAGQVRDNVRRWRAGEDLLGLVDRSAGY